MQNYTIIPLDTDHMEEICLDIKRQYDENIATCALFMMPLVPEGNPPVNKAVHMASKYAKFKKRLNELGADCGILVQSSIGHGRKLNQMFPFQRYVSLRTGEEANVCCPYDEGFRNHFKENMKILAAQKPQVIMLDDDFRLTERPGRGCACPLHLQKLSELIGEKITREELLAHTERTDEKSIMITKAFIKTQCDSLVGAAEKMREGIDEVDPSIPGTYCACNESEAAGEIAKVLAGKNNPVTLRIHNANYTPEGTRHQSAFAYQAARSKIRLGSTVDVFLAETDTCPQNRYSTSAASLHTHFTVSLLEGLSGAKHWITRTINFEPQSGEAYRRILSEYSGFYEEITKTVPTLKWVGANNFISKAFTYGYANETRKSPEWAFCVLERMGIPLYFSSEVENCIFLDGTDAKNFTDEECLEILSGTVIMASNSAEIFEERGFAKYLGVSVREYCGKNPSFERIAPDNARVSTQKNIKEIVVNDESVICGSTVYHLIDEKNEIPLFCGSTVYKNELGGTVIVFAGSPKAAFNYSEAFSFLNEARKNQLADLMKNSGNLPIYYEGDEEVYMKAAYSPDGIFAAIINTGFDPIEKINLAFTGAVSSVQKLDKNGKWQECDYSYDNAVLTVDSSAFTLFPVVLKIFS